MYMRIELWPTVWDKNLRCNEEHLWGTTWKLGEPHEKTLSTRENKKDKIPSSLDTSWVHAEPLSLAAWNFYFQNRMSLPFVAWANGRGKQTVGHSVHCGTLSHAQSLQMFCTVENCFMQQHLYCEALKGSITHHICNDTKLSSVDREL